MLVWYISAAAGVAFIIVALLFADITHRMQDGKEIDVTGHMVCLPHKQGIFGGGETLECSAGFKGDDGKHFVITNQQQLFSDNPELRDSLPPNTSEQFRFSGVFAYGSPGPYEKDRYYTIGAIYVKSLTPA